MPFHVQVSDWLLPLNRTTFWMAKWYAMEGLFRGAAGHRSQVAAEAKALTPLTAR